LIATLVSISVIVSSSSAAAATVIGQTFAAIQCGSGMDTVQMASPTVSYAVPTGGGTITDWSTLAGPSTGPVALEVWRPAAVAGTYTLVDIGPSTPLVANTLNNFHLAIPIVAQANDLLGLRLEGYAECVGYTGLSAEAYGYVVQATPAKGAAGVMRAAPSYRLNVSATVNGTTPLPPPSPGDGQDVTGDGQSGLTGGVVGHVPTVDSKSGMILIH
jgi:hypothetical protein